MTRKFLTTWQHWAVLLPLFTAFASSYAAETQLFDGQVDLSSTRLVAIVLSRNPALPAMQAAWEAADTRIEQVSALDDPWLSYKVAPETAGVPGLDFGQKLEISQKIPWPGKLRLRGKAAQYDADAVHQSVKTLQLHLAAKAKILFADWYFVHEGIRINRINQDLLHEFQQIAITRYSTGLATKQDALRAAVEINLLKHQAIGLGRERREIIARVNRLLSHTPDEPIPLPHKLSEPVQLGKAESLRAQALQSRPELKAQQAHIQEFNTRTELAQREFYPDFNLSTGYNSLWDRNQKRFTVGIGINLPIDQSKRRAAEAEARAKLKQAQWKINDLTAMIEEEVQIAYDRVQETRHVLTLYRRQLLPLAEENLDAAMADYRSGSGDFLTLISTEKNLMQTQLEVERALADSHRRLAELEQAMGRIEPLTTERQFERHQP